MVAPTRTARLIPASDVVKFLETVNGPHNDVGPEHVWRKCRRCLAIGQITDHDQLAQRLLARAIELLKEKREKRG